MGVMQYFSYWKIFLLGFGFFGISVLWSVYNSYVPVFLKEMELLSWLVGLTMTIDNIFAVLMLPYLGVLSDLTRTRIGRRKPYILAGAPPAAYLRSHPLHESRAAAYNGGYYLDEFLDGAFPLASYRFHARHYAIRAQEPG
jgi:MFS family permease